MKTYEEINEKIKSKKVVVVTAEEITDIVKKKGAKKAAQTVDIVTTGTFSPMCSSGVFINFGHSDPPIKANKTLFNNVPAYSGIAAVDCYLGATEPEINDPLNKVYPGEFNYGGGHVIEDLVKGKKVQLELEGYGTDCYPEKKITKEVTLKDLPYATLFNPRNAYQNYNAGINLSNKTIYTYMGILKPKMGNINYSTAGALSPLFNDPYFKTIGVGTKIFLGGGEGYVTWHGTQHNPNVERNEKGVPKIPSGTLFLTGDLKQMSSKWLKGLSIKGYGCSLAVGIGIPIPILNEEMALYTSISDKDISTRVVDYSFTKKGEISRFTYAQLKSGSVKIDKKSISTFPLSSVVGARKIAELLKKQIENGDFFITKPIKKLID